MMTVPQKLYEWMKVLAAVGVALPAIVIGIFSAYNVSEHVILITNAWITGVTATIILLVNIWAKNHWKAIAEDGTTADIEEIDTETGETKQED